MLSREEYAKWAKAFATSQGIKFGEETEALASWYDVLGHYSLAELEAARLAIAKSAQPAPSRFVDYRGWIHRLVHEGRVVAGQAERQDAEQWGECAACNSTGMVFVPHPRCVKNGKWVPLRVASLPVRYYELAVYCNCRLGEWKYQRYTMKPNQQWRPMTLEAYQQQFPGFNWRLAMTRHYAAEMAEIRRGIAEMPGREGEDIRSFGQVMRESFRKFCREPGVDEE